MATASSRAAMRSNRLTGAAARRRLKRPQSWRTKTPSATRRQRLKTIAVAMRLPLSLRLVVAQPRGAAGAALLALVACGRSEPAAVIHTAAGGRAEVAVEVAATPEAQARGLMYRRALADGRGMLFVFPAEAPHEFWMKNTFIPLDMIFIGADGRIVGIHANATPLSTAPLGVERPSRYVLEVPGGWAARQGVAAGDRVELRGIALNSP